MRRLPLCLGLLLVLPACSPDHGFASKKVSRVDFGAVRD